VSFTGQWSLELFSAERAAVEAVAAELAQVPPSLVDDAGWVAEARAASYRLPARAGAENLNPSWSQPFDHRGWIGRSGAVPVG
jgi:hypothetical protein